MAGLLKDSLNRAMQGGEPQEQDAQKPNALQLALIPSQEPRRKGTINEALNQALIPTQSVKGEEEESRFPLSGATHGHGGIFGKSLDIALASSDNRRPGHSKTALDLALYSNQAQGGSEEPEPGEKKTDIVKSAFQGMATAMNLPTNAAGFSAGLGALAGSGVMAAIQIDTPIAIQEDRLKARNRVAAEIKKGRAKIRKAEQKAEEKLENRKEKIRAKRTQTHSRASVATSDATQYVKDGVDGLGAAAVAATGQFIGDLAESAKNFFRGKAGQAHYAAQGSYTTTPPNNVGNQTPPDEEELFSNYGPGGSIKPAPEDIIDPPKA